MSLLITCPVCGPRNGYEFRFGGEDKGEPPDEEQLMDAGRWCELVHLNASRCGVQTEWWYHRDGCGTWFRTQRDTRTNREVQTGEENHG
jgi:sarcosine oxidase subunit delta